MANCECASIPYGSEMWKKKFYDSHKSGTGFGLCLPFLWNIHLNAIHTYLHTQILHKIIIKFNKVGTSHRVSRENSSEYGGFYAI